MDGQIWSETWSQGARTKNKMTKCEGCDQERKHLIKGLCILCRKGPGGNPKEIKETISTGNRGVWKK